MPGTKVRRQITVGNQTCLLGFPGRDSVDSATFDSSTLTPGGVDEVQTLTITGTPTGGTFKLAYNGQTTAAIAYNASAAAVQTALRALSRLGSGIVCAGGALPGTGITITFTGAKLGKQDQPLITVADNSLTGGTTPAPSVAETVKGDSTFANLYVLRSGMVLQASDDGSKVVEWDGDAAVNEQQTVTITGTPTGGTFTLEFDGEVTAAIAYNANAAAVAAALEALPNIGDGNVSASGGALPGTPVVVTFQGDLAGEAQPLMTADGSGLTGGTTPDATVAQTTEGGAAPEIVGIFDGQRELLGPEDFPVIPVYNHECVFDKAVVGAYATHPAALESWARAHACQFKSQGN